MRSWRKQRGGAWALVFWLVVLALFVYLGTKFFPTYVSSNEFVDQMDYTAKEAAAGNLNDEKVHRTLMTGAKDLRLPVDDSNIKITRNGGQVIIEVHYTVIINLPIHGPFKWKFSPSVSKPILN